MLREGHIGTNAISSMLRCSRICLHAARAKAILFEAVALRRAAFLDVSSLNFGGAYGHRRFFWQSGAICDARYGGAAADEA